MVLVPEHVAGSKIITINQDSIAEETFFLFHALYVISSHCISPNGIVDCTYFRKFMKDDGSLENIPGMKINNNNSEDCDNFDTSLNGGLTVSSSTIIFSFLKRVRRRHPPKLYPPNGLFSIRTLPLDWMEQARRVGITYFEDLRFCF
jgi:hypothetical protein